MVLRIISGRLRGRTLASPQICTLCRPTTSKARLSLFNILRHNGANLDECRVLDLFAGTGSLGFEALSAGARHITFVESNRTLVDHLRKTCQDYSHEGTTDILHADATAELGDIGAYDIIFADPPYGTDLAVRAIKTLASGGAIAKDAWVIVEDQQPTAAPEGSNLELWLCRKVGGCFLTLFRAR